MMLLLLLLLLVRMAAVVMCFLMEPEKKCIHDNGKVVMLIRILVHAT
jgi:hypothetical protein